VPSRAGFGAGTARWSDGPLVGRDALIEELVAAADDAVRGRGAVVLLTGEAGIGKTSVARTLVQQVREELVVSWGACVTDQSAPPFWPWRSLVALDQSDAGQATDEAVGSPRFERLTALRAQMRDTLGAPRLHVIEDLQWADVASVLLLAHLGATVADDPILVVATLRTGEPRSPQLDDALEEVRRTATERHLTALDAGDIATLIRAEGGDPDERLVALVGARTGGNPLFVTELLRAVPMAESVGRRLQLVAESVPDRVSDLVLHRVGRLHASVADVVITASVMGAEGAMATLAAALQADGEQLLDLVDQARAAHVLDAAPVGRWQFRHQLIRDAVYGSVSAGDRARRHAVVLEALAADRSTPPAALAHHALAARPLFDADRAVALAARAGESTLAQHAYEEAVMWFSRALSAAPPDTSERWRAELLLLSGEAHRHMGDIGAARQAFLQAADLTDEPALLARAALGFADPGADLGIAYRTDDPTTAELLDRALGAQPSHDSSTAVQLQARLAAELYFSDEPERSRDLAHVALEQARRLDDPRALGAATAVVHDAFVVGQADMDEQLEQSRQLLEWARATGSVAALLTAHRARVFDLLAAGDMAAMDAEILAFRRLAEPLRAPGYLWWPALWSAMHALLDGRHDVAEERALAAYQIGEGPFPTLSFLNLSFLLFFLRREQGRLAEMEQPTRDYAASHADVPAIRVALTFLLAELGRIDEARATLAAFDATALDRLHDRNWPASWFQLARAAAIVGDRDMATTLLEAGRRPRELCVQVSLASVCLGAADLAVAWLLHTVGDLDAAEERYRSAEEANARIGARSWLAQTRADHARLLLERGRPGDPEAALRLGDLAQTAARDIGLATLAPHAVAAPVVAPEATFRHAGSVWQLAYADRAAQLPDARGLHDIAHLLARPGVAVSVLELAGDAAGATAGGRGAEVLDERARREIRARLHELDTDEADAEAAGDGERAALVREQRRVLAEAVARDFGLGGRSRRMGDPMERARKTVSTRIRRTVATVGRVHPELGRHLERSIDTGAWCAYRPAEPVDWTT
jgi:tetratricopeptide (TPR) repeat protein